MQALDVESRQPWEVRLYQNAFRGGEATSKSTLLEDITMRRRSGESVGKLLGEIKVLLGHSDNDQTDKPLADLAVQDSTMSLSMWKLLRTCFEGRNLV